MRAGKRFTEEAIITLRGEIEGAGGREVFALGWVGEGGLVSRVLITARGSAGAVLAVEPPEGPPADVYIHNHPSGALGPSDNDLAIAARAAEEGTGAFIVDNAVEEVYVVAEPARRKAKTPLDEGLIIGALEEGGAVAERLPSYELRRSQLDLMRLVIRGFNEDALVAAEAGTGVGKSFAYLLPALSFALANEERIVISTATITLQRQLFEKDIPLVKKALNADLKVALVKGRGNYLCRRRLSDALMEGALEAEERKALEDIASWAEASPTGDRGDLSFLPNETLWSRVCSDADLCMGINCQERERCFVMSLRKEAAQAKILVVNHHLLFADLAARRAGAGWEGTVVLPACARVIIDEAHTVENSATSFFSEEMGRPGIFRQTGRLYRKKRGGARQGLLPRLAAWLPAREAAVLGGAGEGGEDKAWELILKIRAASEALDAAALELCSSPGGVFRLIPMREEVFSRLLAPHITALRSSLSAFARLAAGLLDAASEGRDEGDKDPAFASTAWEVRAALRRLEENAALCSSFLEFKEKTGEVLWIEKRTGRRDDASSWAAFTIAPIDVAPALSESLFGPAKTVICVSATLAAQESFAYWAGRTGFALAEDRPRYTGVFPSPFPYESAVLLAVPADAPLPEEPGFGLFVDQAACALAEEAGGSALALFTSYGALESAWRYAKPRLEEAGIRVLRQGEADRSRLLETFLADEASVLFATDSFWEGIDAPGDTLRLVIMCRLPFRSPSEPVFEARCEKIEGEGRSAFMELSVPEAVMKFKQGFGRLMRRGSDHGVVAVLDGRLLKKRYGAFFLRSLPETRTCFGDLKTILSSMERFLFR